MAPSKIKYFLTNISIFLTDQHRNNVNPSVSQQGCVDKGVIDRLSYSFGISNQYLDFQIQNVGQLGIFKQLRHLK